MEKNDETLLREYAETRSNETFRALAKRHGPLVYGACLRHLRNSDLAEDAAQAVFLVLAEKAARIRVHMTLIPWCLTTAKNVCRRLARSEARRRRHELTLSPDIEAKNTSTDAALFAALDGLRSEEREAVVLRFVQCLTLAEVGQALGVSEDAARMRVNRGLDRLRRKFVGSVALSPTLMDRLARPGDVSPAIRALVLHRPLVTVAAPVSFAAVGTFVAIAIGVAVLPKHARPATPPNPSAATHMPPIAFTKSVYVGKPQSPIGVLDFPFTLEYRLTLNILTPQTVIDKRVAEDKKRIDADLDSDRISPNEHDRQIAESIHRAKVRRLDGRLTLSFDGSAMLAEQTMTNPDPDQYAVLFRKGQTLQLFKGPNTVCYWNPGINQGFFPNIPLIGPSLPYLPSLRGSDLLELDLAPPAPDGDGNRLAYQPGKVILNKNGSVAEFDVRPDKNGHYGIRFSLSDHVSIGGRWVARKVTCTRYNGTEPIDRVDFLLISGRTEALPETSFLPDTYLSESQPIQLNLPGNKYKTVHFSRSKGFADQQIAALLNQP